MRHKILENIYISIYIKTIHMLSIYMVFKKNIICKLYHIGIRCRKEGGGGVRTIQYVIRRRK